jgi:hypothetical protein
MKGCTNGYTLTISLVQMIGLATLLPRIPNNFTPNY